MKIINGKRSALVFQLDSGQTLRVAPGKISDPFIGTVALVRSLIGSGTPKQVGFVVSNSYELNIIKDLPVANSYYHATEDEAKKALLEGKEFPESASDSAAPAANSEVAELKNSIVAKDKEIEELKKAINEMTAGVPADEFNILKRQLADKESELTALKTRNDNLLEQVESTETDKVELTKKLTDLQSRYDKTSSELLEANNKLKAAVEAGTVVPKNADGQTLEEVTELYKKLREAAAVEVEKRDSKIDELITQLQESQANSVTAEEVEALKAKNAELESKLLISIPASHADEIRDEAKKVIDAKDAEIAQLKADAATVVDSYNKAKSAVQYIMEKFKIAYVDGEYVQQAN